MMKTTHIEDPVQNDDKLAKLKKIYKKRAIGLKVAIFLTGLSLLIAILITPTFTIPRRSLTEGQPSTTTFRAQKSYEIVDEDATAKLKDASESQIKSIYDYEPTLYALMIRIV